MCDNFKCNICNQEFSYKLLKDFHNDLKHDIITYNCELCNEVSFNEDNQITLYQVLDHLYKFHDENIYKILDQLNIY